MNMDLSSVLAALTSHGVPSVTGTTIQVASPQGCTPGVAGAEPSGPFIHPGQHFHGSMVVCGRFAVAFIELRQGYKPKTNSALMRTTGRNMRYSEK